MKLRAPLLAAALVFLPAALHAAAIMDLAGNALTGGTSTDRTPTGANETFILFLAPTVTAASPSVGPTSGGTSVTLTGTNFTGATGVSFGGTAGTGVTVNSATSVTVTSPARAAGTINITVTTPGGTSATGAANQFTFATVPAVNTPSEAGITDVSATLGGNVASDGGTAITERGVVYSVTTANSNPQINGTNVTKVTASGTTGTFTAGVSGLTASTGYSYAAYAINAIGTTYSSVDTFTTLTPVPVITSAATASGTYGSGTFSYTISATNTPTGYNATGLPPGLSINPSSGAITGTPTDTSGSPYTATLIATNGGGDGTATLTITINKRTALVSVSAQYSAAAKVYDGTTAVTSLTQPGTVAFTGKFGTDDVSVDQTNAVGTFASKDVGNRTATISGLTLTGTAASHYTLSVIGSTPAVAITAKALTVSGLSGTSRTYDGTPVATLSGTAVFATAGAAGSGTTGDGAPYDVDGVSPGGTAAGTFASKDVGTSKAITVTGLTVTGAGNGNYIVTQPTGLTADVTPKSLIVTGISAVATRVYDGTTVAGLSGAAAFLATGVAGAGDASDGKPYDVDSVSVSGTAAGAFADRHVASNKAITVTGLTVTGTGNANYSVTQPAGLTANVTAKALTITGVSAVATRIYDGTTVAGLSGTPAFLAPEGAGTGTTADGKPYDVDSVGTGGTAAGVFADRHVGTGKAISVTGITVSGTGSGNYTATQPTGLSADVTPKVLTVAGVTAVATRVYDGTTTAGLGGTAAFLATEAAGAGATADGKPYDVDSVSVSGTAAGVFADRHVASNKAITVTGLTVTGTGNANYTVTQPAGLTANVTAKALTITGVSAVATRIYDGTTVAGLSGTTSLLASETAGTGTTGDGKPYTLDTIALGGAATGTFADRHVANNKAITVTGLTLGSTDAGNYSLVQPTGLTANVTAKVLTVAGLNGGTKVYDATLTAPLTGTAALLSAETAGTGDTGDGKPYTVDSVTLGGTAAGAFTDRHVGPGKAVTVTGLTLGSTDAGNYTVTQPTGLTAIVTVKALTVSGVTASNKTYDATVTATITGTAALQAAAGAGTGDTNDGKPYLGDTVSLAGTMSGAFADRHAATGKTVMVSGLSLNGAEAGNYSVAALTATADIAAKALTISGVTASNRIYDATTVAPLGGTAALATAGAVGAGSTGDGIPYDIDTVSPGGIAAGAFATNVVATAKAITVTGITLTGAQAANYTPTQPTGLTADVTPKTLTVSGLAATSRVYDATTVVALTGTAAFQSAQAAGAGTTSDGKPYTGDDVSLAGTAAAALADRHAGATKPITISGLSLAGAQSANYTVAPPANLTVDVTAKAVTTLGISGVNKIYDGTTVAPLSGTAMLETAQAPGAGTTADGKPYTGDTVSITGIASGAFADRHVGTAKGVTVSALSLTGAQAANYSLIAPVGVTAGITAKALNVTGVTGTNRVYDATTASTLTGTAALLSAQAPGAGTAADGKPYTGDTVTLSGTAVATFADKLAAAAKPVSVTGYALTGANAANYTVTPPATLSADITQKNLSVTGVTAAGKTYDGGTSATLDLTAAALVGVIGGDTVSLVTSGATGAFSSATAGGGKTVTIAGLTLAGTDATNYTLTPPFASASITPAGATISISGLSQVYDGTAKSAIITVAPAVPTIVSYSPVNAPVNAGTYNLSVTVSDQNYTGSSSAVFTIAKASQTVAFTISGADFSVGSSHSLDATASSGLPVTFSIVTGSATLSGSSVVVTQAGSVTLRATQAGNDNYNAASADQSFTGISVSKLPQTIAFAPLSNHNAGEAPFTLSAAASSGLPVSFTVVSGPATLNGSTLTLTGAAGAVTIRASQAGNATYDPAPDVLQSFNSLAVGHQVFFGLTQNDDTIAFDLAPDGKSGMLLCYIGATGEAFIVSFTVNADGSFETDVFSLNSSLLAIQGTDGRAVGAAPVRRTFRGRLSGGTISGSIVDLGVDFSATLQPPSGPTAGISGFYQSSVINSAGGTTASIVGTQGQVLVIVSIATITTGATGTINPDGTFSVAAPGATINGAVDAPTTTVSGTILVPSQPPTSFSGLASSTRRTDRLINLSSRVRVGPVGGRTLITGFVIGGTESKRVLLRAVGPALAGFGVAGALANPRLQLYDGTGRLLTENDDWSGDDTRATFAQVGAFTLAIGTRDAALVATLAPGAYTMHVIDGGETGVALAEIYDASPNPQGEYQRLVNISSRGTVEAGEGVLIGGFIVTGNSPKKVLVRGVGPGLAAFGVTGALTDPRLAIFSGSTVVAQNNDWATPQPIGGGQVVAPADEIAAGARLTGAFGFASGSKDAAVIVTLAPGAYTAQVTSADDTTTGVALVEIYEVPE